MPPPPFSGKTAISIRTIQRLIRRPFYDLARSVCCLAPPSQHPPLIRPSLNIHPNPSPNHAVTPAQASNYQLCIHTHHAPLTPGIDPKMENAHANFLGCGEAVGWKRPQSLTPKKKNQQLLVHTCPNISISLRIYWQHTAWLVSVGASWTVSTPGWFNVHSLP